MKALPAHDPPVPRAAQAGARGAASFGRGVLILNWRDTTNPEGGGSEVYVERVAAGLAARWLSRELRGPPPLPLACS